MRPHPLEQRHRSLSSSVLRSLAQSPSHVHVSVRSFSVDCFRPAALQREALHPEVEQALVGWPVALAASACGGGAWGAGVGLGLFRWRHSGSSFLFAPCGV